MEPKTLREKLTGYKKLRQINSKIAVTSVIQAYALKADIESEYKFNIG